MNFFQRRNTINRSAGRRPVGSPVARTSSPDHDYFIRYPQMQPAPDYGNDYCRSPYSDSSVSYDSGSSSSCGGSSYE